MLMLSGVYGVEYGFFARKNFTHAVSIPKTKGMLTTEIQKQKIQGVYDFIQQNRKDKQKMFIFGHMPMMYYLNDLQPAGKDYWLMGHDAARLRAIVQELPLQEDVLILEDRNIQFPPDSRVYFHSLLRQQHYVEAETKEDLFIWTKKQSDD